MEEKEVQNRMQRVEELVQDIESWPDPNLRAKAVELVQSLMDFHGTGLEQMMDTIAETGETASRAIFDSFARDKLVGSMLLLYGLHPIEFEARIIQALDKAQAHLRLHGGSVELLGIADGVVQLRLQGSGKTCGSSSMAALKLAVEEAIYEAAPDVAALEVDEVSPPPAASGFVQLERRASYG